MRNLLLLTTVLITVASIPCVAGEATVEAARCATSTYRDGWIQYLEVQDPEIAAQQFLSNRRELGVDLDRRPSQSIGPFAIGLASGWFTPEPLDTTAIGVLNNVVQELTVPICIVQFRRSVTSRELAQLMTAGVRPISEIPAHSLIAEIPPSVIQKALSLDFVGWIGAYKPEYKYTSQRPFVSDQITYVEPLIGNCPEFIEELARIGGRSIAWESSIYSVQIEPSLVTRVAELWWVKQIWQPEVSFPED